MCCIQVWISEAALLAQNGSKELVKLWGEDALLSWPGALQPVIHERDVHMAKTIWAAATGKCKTTFVQSCLWYAAFTQLQIPAQAADGGLCNRVI